MVSASRRDPQGVAQRHAFEIADQKAKRHLPRTGTGQGEGGRVPKPIRTGPCGDAQGLEPIAGLRKDHRHLARDQRGEIARLNAKRHFPRGGRAGAEADIGHGTLAVKMGMERFWHGQQRAGWRHQPER